MKLLILYTHTHTGNLKNNKGITLIALVTTIIILLILAGITIVQLTGSRLFGKVELANQEVDNIEFSYEKKRSGSNKLKLVIKIKDEKNGIDMVQYPDGEILKCNEKNQIGIDYTIEYGVEYIFKITSNNNYEKVVSIYEEKPNTEVVVISNKEYTFTCIDKNYQGYNLYLCDEVIPYNVCGSYGSIYYKNSKLRTWLNDNAPENAIEITLEDTETTEKMFILSKEEDEKYEEYPVLTWEGSKTMGNTAYWTRTYAGKNGWMYCRSYYGVMSYLDIRWTSWNGCKPAFVLDR